MGDQANQRAAYDYLRARAIDGKDFTVKDFGAAANWKGTSPGTYVSKLYRQYLRVSSGRGRYTVIREFRRVTWEEFRELVTQVRRPFASYTRTTYHCVVVYDFLMPLTREDRLRRALDELFYKDTLERRLEEIGLPQIKAIIPSNAGESDAAYVARVVSFINDRIGGFSISHVSGRFRVGEIVTRHEFIKKLAKDEPYLIDETTAVVRFIIPCDSSKRKHETDFSFEEPGQATIQAVETEVDHIRRVFFEIFVEALVPTIRGEKLIWMLETTPKGQRLYELLLDQPESKDDTKESDDEDDVSAQEADEA
jgi:hypothetical protein